MGFLSILRGIQASENEARVLIVGLDCSGKTTVVASLLGKDMADIAPTLGFNIDTWVPGPLGAQGAQGAQDAGAPREARPAGRGLTISLWDVGGQATIRTYWRNYYSQTDALVWVVDSTDRRRLDLCRRALAEVLHSERLRGCPVLVLCNKQDVTTALPAQEVSEVLGLPQLCAGRDYAAVGCSAREKIGVEDAFAWLLRELEENIGQIRAEDLDDDLEAQVW